MELQRLEFYVSRMRNLVICYFVFKNQSHYSGVRGQRVKGPLEYLQVSATTLMSLLFIYMIPIDCKIFLTKRPASKFSKMVRDLLAEIP